MVDVLEVDEVRGRDAITKILQVGLEGVLDEAPSAIASDPPRPVVREQLALDAPCK